MHTNKLFAPYNLALAKMEHAHLSYKMDKDGRLSSGQTFPLIGPFGACFRGDAPVLESAIAELKNTAPSLPADAGKVIGPNGEIDQKIVQALHAWIMPAWRLSQTANGGSLALPTWYYGHEPSTPFATHIAKYFQNSIREDGLIALAARGIVFASGKAGTLQEIFQDSVRNYYRGPGDPFSPMVFLRQDVLDRETAGHGAAASTVQERGPREGICRQCSHHRRCAAGD